jgi:acetoin utilization protein AcuC
MSNVLVHSDNYINWVFDPKHPTQGRRFTNAKNSLISLIKENNIEVVDTRKALRKELEIVHSSEYVSKVIDNHESGEWSGKRPDLSELASMFVGGTLVALDKLLQGSRTAIHFPGAKHHAQHDRSSGFCVFSDFAIAAHIATEKHGKRVAILDIDAHHGDGTEHLTISNDNVLTFSIHEYGIFPGTGYASYPQFNVFNYPLNSPLLTQDSGVGDKSLHKGIDQFIKLAKKFKPDMLFVACGADAHETDPLSNLKYTVEGYVNVATKIRNTFPNMPILMGGAGGYQPDTYTPEIWSRFAFEIIKNEKRKG